MDASLYRSINRLADHASWAHPIFTAYAKGGVVLFAVLLLAVRLFVPLLDRMRSSTLGFAVASGRD